MLIELITGFLRKQLDASNTKSVSLLLARRHGEAEEAVVNAAQIRLFEANYQLRMFEYCVAEAQSICTFAHGRREHQQLNVLALRSHIQLRRFQEAATLFDLYMEKQLDQLDATVRLELLALASEAQLSLLRTDEAQRHCDRALALFRALDAADVARLETQHALFRLRLEWLESRLAIRRNDLAKAKRLFQDMSTLVRGLEQIHAGDKSMILSLIDHNHGVLLVRNRHLQEGSDKIEQSLKNRILEKFWPQLNQAKCYVLLHHYDRAAKVLAELEKQNLQILHEQTDKFLHLRLCQAEFTHFFHVDHVRSEEHLFQIKNFLSSASSHSHSLQNNYLVVYRIILLALECGIKQFARQQFAKLQTIFRQDSNIDVAAKQHIIDDLLKRVQISMQE